MKMGARMAYPVVLMAFGAIIALMFIQPVPSWAQDTMLSLDKNLTVCINAYNDLEKYQKNTERTYSELANVSITYISKDYEKGMVLCRKYGMNYYPTSSIGELGCFDENETIHLADISKVKCE